MLTGFLAMTAASVAGGGSSKQQIV